KKSSALIIGIVVAAIAVLGLGGLAIGLLGGKDDPLPPPPPPPTVQPTPTTNPTTDPTTEPTTDPDPAPTTEPTPGGGGGQQTQPSGNAIQLSNGMSVTPASGWTVAQQNANAVLLQDARGRSMIISTGRVNDPRNDVTELLRRLTADGSDVRLGDVETPDLHSSIDVARQAAAMTATSGGGSTRIGMVAIASSRKADQTGFLTVVAAPPDAFQDDSFTEGADAMVESLFRSQVENG
ncbi:MAG: hypothetical protein Q4F67_08020, partial [Propionibacteriaceae bacterium]|nr:hypothetical protein [Propionibacteriaceae bacterium]